MLSRVAPVLLALASIVPTLGHAQQRTAAQRELDAFYAYGDTYFLEVAVMPSPSTAKGRALVSFRLSYDLLLFRKGAESFRRDAGVYEATPTMFVEAVGSDGVISDRGFWRDTVRVADFVETNSKTRFAAGSVSLELRPGIYEIRYTLQDGSPTGLFTETIAPVKMDDFNAPSPAIGSPIILRRIVGDTLVPAVIDGNAPFGRPFLAYVPLSSSRPPDRLRYDVVREATADEPEQVMLSGWARMLGAGVLAEPSVSEGELRYVIVRPTPGPDGEGGAALSGMQRHHGALIDASSASMQTGDYLLLLTYEAGHGSITDSVRFSLRWIDMPATLSNTEAAIRALYPIATDETIEELMQGGAERRRRALLAFWAERDPSPGTHYNEAMAEYYRRADHALFTFRSLSQENGVHTDRGKIYMLFGPPTEIARQMLPDEPPREVWTYSNRVAQRFVFVDERRSGNYRLVEHHKL